MCGHVFSSESSAEEEPVAEDNSKSRIRHRSDTNFVDLNKEVEESAESGEESGNHLFQEQKDDSHSDGAQGLHTGLLQGRPKKASLGQSEDSVESQEGQDASYHENAAVVDAINEQNQGDEEPKKKRKRRRRKRKKPGLEADSQNHETEAREETPQTERDMNDRRDLDSSDREREQDYHREEEGVELPERETPTSRRSRRPEGRREEEREEVESDADLVGWLISFNNPAGEGIELRSGRFFVTSDKVKPDDLVLDHSSISVPHCIFKADKGSGFMVQDLMSENGTWIKKAGESDYSELVEATPVDHGDYLKLGDFETLVCLVPREKKKRASKSTKSSDKE